MKDKRKGNILLLLSEYDKIDIEIKGFSRGSIPLEYTCFIERTEKLKMFYCSHCQKYYPEDTHLWRCNCGTPFSYLYSEQLSFPKEKIKVRDNTMWRYWEALPGVNKENITSLGEGMTPLIPALLEGRKILFKLEFISPTGSFKDRGTSFFISKLKDRKVTRVIEDSSGNAGASLAAYCAYSGIKCEIYVPEYTSAGKLLQIEMYGAKIKKISGSREDTAIAAIQAAREHYYASHNWNPYFLQGIKTIAFEIWEQLLWQVPDNIIVPAGQGSLVLGCHLGFNELKAAGEIKKVPRIFAVQAANCAPLYQAFYHGLSDPVKIEKKETMAEGISSAFPIRGREVLSAIRESNGEIIAVEEKEIMNSLPKVIKLGFYIEPTSAVATAGLVQLFSKNTIKETESTIVILTGSGLKATDKIGKLTQAQTGNKDDSLFDNTSLKM
ncbi:MAG: threonine synthase [Atribacterota bacterium]|nr:threonine synthase [Atribacterota bacterium]